MEDKDSSVIIEKVAYGLTIGDLKFGNTRPGVVEATLKPGFTLEDALDELDERLNAWHKKRYPNLYQDNKVDTGMDLLEHMQRSCPPDPPPVIQVEKTEHTQADTLFFILSSPSLEDLQTYKKLAAYDKDLYAAYNKRIKELIPSV